MTSHAKSTNRLLRVGASKDFWSGIIFMTAGLGAVVLAQDYAMGSAGRMGPAYFPTVLGAALAAIGLIICIGSLIAPREAAGGFAWKKACLILLAAGVFSLLVRGIGLALSVVITVMIGGYASERFRVFSYLALAIGLAVFSVVVFVMILGLPIPVLGPWLGKYAWP